MFSEKGEGTRFDIYLPAAGKNARRPQSQCEAPLRGTELILLVDAEKMILDISQEMLEKLGYQVITASNGKRALEVYRRDQNKIDMVILDMIMPDMSGAETYDRLK
ncbi:MAG: response regulator, partial [Desulfobacterales bacterium]